MDDLNLPTSPLGDVSCIASKADKGGLAAAALATTNATVRAAQEGKPPSDTNGELPRQVTVLSIRQEDGRETLGVKTKAGVLDVAAASRLLGFSPPLSLEELLTKGGNAELDALVEAALKTPKAKSTFRDESKIKFGRLFKNPGKIICVGLNYREHAEEAGQKPPAQPILFNKYNNALAPHQATIQLPPREICSSRQVVSGWPARRSTASLQQTSEVLAN